jgi:enoyl-CoA hydratase
MPLADSIHRHSMSSNPQAIDAPGRINVSVQGGVGWIELDNPAKLNAISIAMWQSLVDALARLGNDAALRCVVITGHGDKAFCAGADIEEKSGAHQMSEVEQSRIIVNALGTVQRFAKPTIAMISGYCLGGGLALAAACDLRVASSGSRFGLPAAKLGQACFYNVVERLAHLVGPSTTKRIIFTADRFPAEEALRMGLVDDLVDDLVASEMLHGKVRAMAAGIAANAPLAIMAAKHVVETIFSGAAESDRAACEALGQGCAESQDYVEGRRAFIEKRAPVFLGR